jgi:hypothetical protein
MPTVLIEGPYRFFWYSYDRTEPPHVHVERDQETAKFWLDSVRLERNNRFSMKELNRIRAIITAHRDELLERWRHDFSE